MKKPNKRTIEVGLNTTIVSVADNMPLVLKVQNTRQSTVQNKGQQLDSLPFGAFDPTAHRTMEMGLRRFVQEQTGLGLGYVEQLYTFGDRGRLSTDIQGAPQADPHVISVGYLALMRPTHNLHKNMKIMGAEWKNWYSYFPWEDQREGRPGILDDVIIPKLLEWARNADPYKPQYQGMIPSHRVNQAFGANEKTREGRWDEELVLERYELLYSAGLLEEAVADQRVDKTGLENELGTPMVHDHRRIMATAISRLRGKLKYRPVIFELMEEEFTLLQLQQTVESIFGKGVHKQNFRRLVENTHLVEPTGKTSTATGGRPAALFRFRREVLQERPSPGLRIGGRG